MGLFWLIIAWTAADTIVKASQALSQRASGKHTADDHLERRIRELEECLTTQMELNDAREATIERLEEKVEFNERLLANRADAQAAAPQQREVGYGAPTYARTSARAGTAASACFQFSASC